MYVTLHQTYYFVSVFVIFFLVLYSVQHNKYCEFNNFILAIDHVNLLSATCS